MVVSVGDLGNVLMAVNLKKVKVLKKEVENLKELKYCSKCKRYLPLSEFTKDRRYREVITNK
jgi:hypothetical protein